MLTDELILEIAEDHDFDIDTLGTVLVEYARAILAAHSAGAQEPVALTYSERKLLARINNDNKSYVTWDDRQNVLKLVYRLCALYAHPQPMTQTDAARDAKRYQWLREHFDTVHACDIEGNLTLCAVRMVFDEPKEALDAAIDYAIDRAKGE